MNWLIALLFVTQAALAEEKSIGTKIEETAEKAGEKITETTDKVSSKLAETRENRELTNWTFAAHFTPFSMWTMMDYGFSASYREDAKYTYELDFSTGQLGFGYFGIDVGRIRERKYSFIRRSYNTRNSFNFLAGLFINDLDVKLGNKYLAAVSPSIRSGVDLLQIQTAGVSFGLGNRWQFKNGADLGVDWLMINLPLWTITQRHPFLDASTNQDYVDDIQSALKVFRRIPTFAILRIQAGYSF